MVIGVGIDVVDIDRFASALARRESLAARLFTAGERAYCERARAGRKRAERYAARFAAKEAAMKAVGVGLGAWGFHDVSVERSGDGCPTLVVVGRADAYAASRGVARWTVSLTHSDLVAAAVVVAESDA